MLKSIKKFCLITIISSICCFGLCTTSGCINRQPHHDGNSIEWIEKQVKEGKLTRAQADELIKQEQENNQ